VGKQLDQGYSEAKQHTEWDTLSSTHDSETTQIMDVNLASKTFLDGPERSGHTRIPFGEPRVPRAPDMKSFSGVHEGFGHLPNPASMVDLRPKVPWSSARTGEASKRRSLNLSSNTPQPQLHPSMSIPDYGNPQFPIAEIKIGTPERRPFQLSFDQPSNASHPRAMNGDEYGEHQIPFTVSKTLPTSTSMDQLY